MSSRRPLFTTGLPQVLPQVADIIATPNSALSVLDLRSLSEELQSFTRYVTLYAMNQSAGSADVVSVAWREGTGTPLQVVAQTLTTGISPPVKILDRFPLRGDVELIASAAVGDSPLIWGYFEFDGKASDPDVGNLRPLLPGALTAPFSYSPAASADGSTATLHLLDPNFYDLISVDVVVAGTEASLEKINITDGTDSVVVKIGDDGSTLGLAPVRIFDGIPMMGSGSGSPELEIETSVAGTVSIVFAWGSFVRVT